LGLAENLTSKFCPYLLVKLSNIFVPDMTNRETVVRTKKFNTRAIAWSSGWFQA
jgi:hypothetical protein